MSDPVAMPEPGTTALVAENRIFVPLTAAEVAGFAKRRCKHCLGLGMQTVTDPSGNRRRVACGCTTHGLSQRDDIVEHNNVISWVRKPPSTVTDAAAALVGTFGEGQLRLAIAQDPARPIANHLGAGFTGAQILAELERVRALESLAREMPIAADASDGTFVPVPFAASPQATPNDKEQ